MTPKRCDDTRHDFEKFDDATIYCRRCGEQRVVDVAALIAKLPQPTYLPCPGPHYYWPPYVVPTSPTWEPFRWNPTVITSTSTYVPNDTVTVIDDNNVTYTGGKLT